jgi:TPR repeat protein
MFRRGDQPDIALEILEPIIRALPRDGWEVSVAEQLIKLGHPHRALRLIRSTRQLWVKDWTDEWRARVLVAGDALAALRRPKQALELYRIAAKAGDPDAAARMAELERERQVV